MVVIHLKRPQSNLEAVAAAGKTIFEKIGENQKKLETEKRIKQILESVDPKTQKVTRTINPATGAVSLSIADLTAPEKGLGLFKEGEGGLNLGATPQVGTGTPSTIQPSSVINGGALAPSIPGTPSEVPTIGGFRRGETTLRKQSGGESITQKLVPIPTEAERGIALEEKRQAKEIEVQGQARGQSEKAAELAQRDFLRASAAVDTAFDQAINFGEGQLKKFNLRPGQFFGIVDRVTPSELNQFKAGFVGAGKESAALIARQIIPGVRAANITRIFAKSSAELGATMESNANNVAASMGNAFANALSQNIAVFDEDTGRQVKIQDKTIDKKTGQPLSQLDVAEKSRAINDLKRQFSEDLADDYLVRTFERNPELLQPETRKIIEQQLNREKSTFTTPGGVEFFVGE